MNYHTALVQLPLVREHGGEPVRTPEDAYRVCADIATLAQESFQVLLLNAKHRLIDREMVSLGLVDASLAHPREVFRAAICAGASAVVLCHGHPSGPHPQRRGHPRHPPTHRSGKNHRYQRGRPRDHRPQP